ncbi:MAG TPA: hypothetical protein VKC60_08515 [Opitutaceae bacterium]|nr:hypothetical protein [Opitutaceae bacterium]
MKFARRSLYFLVVTWFGLTAARAAVPFLSLVDDDTAFVVSANDVPALIKKWDASPAAHAWNDPEIEKFFAPLRAKMKIDEWDDKTKAETGYTVRELLGLVTGQILVSVGDIPAFLKLNEGAEPSFALLGDIGGNQAAIEKLMAKEREASKEEESTEEFQGETLHLRKHVEDDKSKERPSWAIVKGIFVSALPVDRLRRAVAAIKHGSAESPLSASSNFQTAKQHMGEADYLVYCNIEAIYPTIEKAANDKFASKKSGPQNPMAPDPQAIIKALGLDVLRTFYFSGRLDADGGDSSLGLTFSENRGIVKLLAFGDGPVPQPAFVSNKWVTVSSTNFSFKDAFAALEEILANASPALSSMVQSQIQQFGKNLGIDIKRDLIGSTGPGLISGYSLKDGQSADAPPAFDQLGQFLAMSLTNAQAFENAFEALKRMTGPNADQLFKKRNYLGFNLYTFEAPTPPQAAGAPPVPKPAAGAGFSYAVTPEYFFMSTGSVTPLETALQGLRSAQPTLWENSDVKRALANVPGNACSISYQDLRVIMPAVVETFVKMDQMQSAVRAARAPKVNPPGTPPNSPPAVKKAASTNNWLTETIDPKAKPDPTIWRKYVWFAVSYTVRDNNGIYIYGHSQNPR